MKTFTKVRVSEVQTNRTNRNLVRSTSSWMSGLLLISSLAAAEVIVVDDLNDAIIGSMHSCQLRDAIVASNTDSPQQGCPAGNGADIIEFAGTGGITLVSDLPTITDDLEINGPGPDLFTLDGDDQHRMFLFHTGVIGVLRGLTLFQGNIDFGGSCFEAASSESLLVEDVVVEACSANSGDSGAARLFNVPTTLRRVSFLGNQSPSGSGLKILASTTIAEDLLFASNTGTGLNNALVITGPSVATFRRCTFFDNESERGAAIAIGSNSSLTLEHCTVTGNRGTSSSFPGAVTNSGTLTLFNTIIANNERPAASVENADIKNFVTLVSMGHNMIGNNDGIETEFPAGLPNANLDLVGTNLAPVLPALGPLQDNGGPQKTMEPEPSSLAIDQGSCFGEAFDQRGYHNRSTFMRPVDDPGVTNSDDGCDTGAVERGAMRPELFSDGFETGDTTNWS